MSETGALPARANSWTSANTRLTAVGIRAVVRVAVMAASLGRKSGRPGFLTLYHPQKTSQGSAAGNTWNRRLFARRGRIATGTRIAKVKWVVEHAAWRDQAGAPPGPVFTVSRSEQAPE